MTDNSDFAFKTGLGNAHGGTSSIMVTQAIPDTKKKVKWQHANMDTLERIGEKQIMENRKFKDYYDMQAGRLTYQGSGLGEFTEMTKFAEDIKKISEDKGIPSYLKHYDFIGIVVNVLVGIYSDFQDVFRVDSIDEYSTNEFIRQKTEMLGQYASQVFQQELTKLLLGRGIDPMKDDFETEEEAKAYQQQLDQQKQALTPPEIENFMAKNFKVLATEWAENTLAEDQKRKYLDDLDRQEFIDKLLTGRFFRHFRIGYDSYTPERWCPMQTFFSQNIDTRYPQDGEYIGRIHWYSPSDIINRYGHLLSAKEQEAISNYWNQNDSSYSGEDVSGSKNIEDGLFERHTVPFANYYPHQLLTEFEQAIGEPLAERTIIKDGEEHTFRDYLPQYGTESSLGTHFARNLRDDINIDDTLIQVTEVYWRSYKRMGLLVHENEHGAITTTVTTDELLPELLESYEIKRLRTVSLQEVEDAVKKGDLSEYVDTIVYSYVPEIWQGIKIKNTTSKLKGDIYLDIRPLDFQIKADSDVFDFKLPVGGFVGNSLVMKMVPYQIMHNMCMNQICDILEKELGIFFLMDINYLPSEFMKSGDHKDALYELREFAKDVGFLPVDMSKQNAPTSQNINSFQRQDITYGSQVEYRWSLAQNYKEEGLKQIGITPQLLGQPNKYITSAGVENGAQASFAQIMPVYAEMNIARAKVMEIHLAVAQYCHSNGKDNSVFYRKSDGDHYFLDIMKEDETFSLRRLGVVPVTGTKDRKVLEAVKQYMIQDNTVTKSFQTIVDVLSNPTLAELKHIGAEERKRQEREVREQREFESSQLDKQLAKQDQLTQRAEQFKAEEAEKDRQSKEDIAYMQGLSNISDKNSGTDEMLLYKTEATNLYNHNKLEADTAVKMEGINAQKEIADKNLSVRLKELAENAKLKREQMATDKFTSTINKN